MNFFFPGTQTFLMDEKCAVAEIQDLETQQKQATNHTDVVNYLNLQRIKERIQGNRHLVAIALFTFIIANVVVFVIDCPSTTTTSLSSWSEQKHPQNTIDKIEESSDDSSQAISCEQTSFDDYNPFQSTIQAKVQLVNGVVWWKDWRLIAKIISIAMLVALVVFFFCLIDYGYVWASLQKIHDYFKDRLSTNYSTLQRLFDWIKEQWNSLYQKAVLVLQHVGLVDAPPPEPPLVDSTDPLSWTLLVMSMNK